MRITLTRSAANSGVVTGNVPGDGGMRFSRPRCPAIASMGMTMKKRPTSIATASVTLYQCVFAERPPNAEPLLPVADVYAYKISERPCGQVLLMTAVPNE